MALTRATSHGSPCHDGRVSVEFDPVRIGSRRRRLDPLAVGAALVVVALAVAVVKPWESSGKAAASPRASVGALASAAPSPSPPARPTRSPSASTRPGSTTEVARPTWTEIAPVLGSHEQWGTLALVGRASRFTASGAAPIDYASRWDAGPPGAGRGSVAILKPDDLTVIALGLTFPSGQAPDDVRIWERRAHDELEWIDATASGGPSPADPLLYLRPGPSESSVEPWQPGRYRLDVLRGGRVDRLEVAITDAFGDVPDPVDRPVTESRLVPPEDSDPSIVRLGLFATVDGLGFSLHFANSRPLDEMDAWAATLEQPDRGPARTVATVFLPRATGIGVMLTAHASIRLAVLRRLAPSPLVPVPPTVRGVAGPAGETPYVVFAAPDGEALPPGAYAVSVGWAEGGSLHAGTWHVELRPGPVPIGR
jgi:hypothetical protein